MHKKHFLLIKLTLLFISLFSTDILSAQYDAQFSQYMLNPSIFNPAAIGEGEELNVSLYNRQQWTSIDNAPSTFLFNASIPKIFGKIRSGFGLFIMNEKIGLFSTQLFQAQYAYRKPLWGGLLGLGIQGGMLQEDFDGAGIYIPSSDYHVVNDLSAPTGTVSGKIPDFSAGIWFSHPRFSGGFSVSHLLETTLKLKQSTDDSNEDAYKIKASRTYYLTGGYNIAFSSPLYTLQPSFLLKSDLVAWQTDLSAKFTYNDHYWGMAGWRPKDAIVVSAGIKLPQGLSIGYSYDISLTLWGTSGGSHEIFLGYSKKIETATVSKKQKSVRIL